MPSRVAGQTQPLHHGNVLTHDQKIKRFPRLDRHSADWKVFSPPPPRLHSLSCNMPPFFVYFIRRFFRLPLLFDNYFLCFFFIFY